MPRNFRKLPHHVLDKLANIDNNEIVVGFAKTYNAKEIEDGLLNHLQIYVNETGLILPEPIIPCSKMGKYSKRNAEGSIIIRRDLPKCTLYYRTMEAPNWNGNGTHDVEIPVNGYPRDIISPTLFSITINSDDPSSGLAKYTLRFRLNHTINKTAPDFRNELLYCINILQENISNCDIYPSDITMSEYLAALHVEWELLPPDTSLQRIIQHLFSRRILTDQEQIILNERKAFIESLNPQQIILGTSGFVRYYGALVRNNLAVFDNIRYGNALYIMFEDWQFLSRRSRIELLSGRFGTNFYRIPHKNNWQMVAKNIINRSNQN